MGKPKIAVIGTGNMGGALIRGWLARGLFRPGEILAVDVRPEALKNLPKGVLRASSLTRPHPMMILLSVKPHDVAMAVRGIPRTSLIISIAAGIPTRRIENFLPKKTAVIRVMPNTPAQIGYGMAVLSAGRWAKKRHLLHTKKLFEAVGEAILLPERFLNSVTAISGSGPAYLFYLAEAFLAGAKRLGLPEKASDKLIRQTLLGASQMLAQGKDPSLLRQAVTSKGGTTEAALGILEKGNFQKTFIKALFAAKRRAGELSR